MIVLFDDLNYENFMNLNVAYVGKYYATDLFGFIGVNKLK